MTGNDFIDVYNGAPLKENNSSKITKLDNGYFGDLMNRGGFCTQNCTTFYFNCTACYCHEYGDACDGAPDQQPFFIEICGEPNCYDTNPENSIDEGGSSGGGGGGVPGDSDIVTNPNPTEPCQDSSGQVGITDSGGCTLVTEDDECSVSDLDFNSYYSQFSPFQVDLIEVQPSCEGISTNDIDNEKFMCLYNKLIQSNKYKALFLKTFEESQNLNVKFKLSDTLSVNGRTKVPPGSTINSQTGDLILNVEIYINSNYLQSTSAIGAARTILHESIHAYLILKHLNCNLGTPFEELVDDINNKSLEELLNYYYATSCPTEEEHEFMFDKMIPAMSEILADIRDALIPLTHRQLAESDMSFKDENNPNGPTVAWNWNDFYKYLSMDGLQNTDSFQWNIPPGSHLEENFIKYARTYGRDSFRKECNE